MYIWDQTLNAGVGGYRTHNGTIGVPAGTTPFIPAMNGFFVNALNAGTLTLNQGSLTHSSQTFYRTTDSISDDRVRIKIVKQGYSDEALILFDPTAGNEYEPLLDVLKLSSGNDEVPEISTLTSGGLKLCINYLKDFPVSVPLIVDYGIPDTLELIAFDFEELDPTIGIYLEDTKTGETKNLREDPVYRFYHEVPGYQQRFILHFSNQTTVEDEVLKRNIHVFVFDHRINVIGNDGIPVSFFMFDVAGRCVEKGIISSSYDLGHIRPGIYIMEFRSGQTVYRQKFIL